MPGRSIYFELAHSPSMVIPDQTLFLQPVRRLHILSQAVTITVAFGLILILLQCSNFSCCGLSLADMHELLDHFEESHVVVVSQDGRPVYPCISNSNNELDLNASKPLLGQCASLVLSYPSVESPGHAGEAALAELDALRLDTSSLSSGSTSAISSPIEPMCLPPSLLTIKPSARKSHASLDCALHHGGHLPLPTSNDTLACRDRKASVRRIKSKLFGGSGRADRRHANSKRREREKMHKCPVSSRHSLTVLPRAMTLISLLPYHVSVSAVRRYVLVFFRDLRSDRSTPQSYLNPNGLKYHLEKGTCTVMGAVV